MLVVRENLSNVVKIGVASLAVMALATTEDVFAQSNKELAKMYNQLDSLENRKLELQRENDRVVLDCLKSNRWYVDDAYSCRSAVGLDPFNRDKWREKSRETCECMVGKKHEIEAVETQIKQQERRIELFKQENSKATPTMK